MLTIEIPNLKPVSVNQMWVTIGKLTPQAQAYMEAVAWITKSQIKGKRIPQGELSAVTIFYSPKWYTKARKIARIDVDNLTKLTTDGIFRGLGMDDKVIFDNRQIKAVGSRFHITMHIFPFAGFSLERGYPLNFPENTLKNS